MAAPKPTMRRRKPPSSAALEFVEGDSKKTKQAAPRPKTTTVGARKKASPKPTVSTLGDDDEKRVAKRLYLPEDVERELRVRSATDGVQQSEIATAALRKYLGL